jgi:hypothetical protein
MVDIQAMSVGEVAGLPPGMAGVAGDAAASDFWLADRHGRLLWVEAGGRYAMAAETGMEKPAGGAVACGGGRVIWSGSALSKTLEGADMTPAFVFFDREGPGGQLRRTGDRTYVKHEGTTQAWDYDGGSGALAAVLGKVLPERLAIRSGTRAEFSTSAEYEETDGLKGYSGAATAARLTAGGNGLVVLLRDGTVLWLAAGGAGKWALAASVRPSSALTDLARGRSADGSALMVADGTKLVRCYLEGA